MVTRRGRAAVALTILGVLVAGEFHAPGTAPSSHAPQPKAPDVSAPTHRNQQVVDLSPMPVKSIVTGFSNPFRQYEGGSIPDWNYGGDATLFNDYMSLTPARPNSVGWVWSTRPLEMPSWEVEFEFHVGGAKERGSGGGLAFWWAAEPSLPGTIYGHADNFNGIGIFFDTYEPTGHAEGAAAHSEPYIVAMVNDGKRLGAQVLQDAERLASQQVAVCFASYRNMPHVARARVAWANGTLRLWLDLERSHVYQPCLETAVGDVRMGTLPSTGYFGISASTGPYGDAHVLYSVSAARLDPLLDDVEIAHAHEAKPGEMPVEPAHEVHKEATDHETHMKILPNELPAEHHAEPGAEPQHPTPVHVPPSQDENEMVMHMVSAMEASHEIRDELSGLREEVTSIENHCTTKQKEMHDLVKLMHAELTNIKSVLHAPGTAPVPSGLHAPSPVSADGQHAPSAVAFDALHGKFDSHGRSMEEHGRLLATVSEKVDASAADAAKATAEAVSAGKHLLGKVETIDSVLESRLTMLSAQFTKLKEEVDHTRMISQSIQSELRSDSQNLKAVLEQLKKLNGASAGSGAYGWFPLAVCAQALVVCAVLFYAIAGGGGGKRKSSSHLP